MVNRYIIAGKVIDVNSIYESVHDYCMDYVPNELPDFSVKITHENIAAEKQKTDSEYAYEGLPTPNFLDALFEETAIYRKIADVTPDYDILVFHGSVIAVNDQGYLFTAKSGIGKSTHTRLWREYFGEHAVMGLVYTNKKYDVPLYKRDSA